MIPKNISYYFFDKLYTKSTHLYLLNENNDNYDIVKNNISTVVKDIKASGLVILKQSHSNQVIEAQSSFAIGNEIEADGSVTNVLKLALGVLTADCYPILLMSRQGEVVSALHCGWKGIKAGIINNAIDIMKNKYNVKDICAIVGPGIGVDNYEVDISFAQSFINDDYLNSKFFIKVGNKLLFNLPMYIRHQLEAHNVKIVLQIDHDTYYMSEHYYSYRRNIHTNAINDQRRLLSVVMINH